MKVEAIHRILGLESVASNLTSSLDKLKKLGTMDVPRVI